MSFYLLQQVIDSNISEACSSFCQLVSMGEAIIISLWLTLSYNPDISSFLARSLSPSFGSRDAWLYCSGNSAMLCMLVWVNWVWVAEDENER